MASITATQAGQFSGPSIPSRYYYDCRPTDQLFKVLPFEPIAGKEIQLNIVDASTDGLGDLADAVAAGGALNATMPTINTRTYELKRIAAEMPVDSALLSKFGSQNDLLAALIQLKVNAVRDHFKKLLITGDSGTNAEEFDGLNALVAAGNSTGANNDAADGGTVLKGEIEDLVSVLNPRDGETYLVMHSKVYGHLRRNNYTDVEYVAHPVLGTLPVIAGVPTLFHDYPPDETRGASSDTQSIWAVTLGKDVGLCGIYPAADQGQPIQVRGPVVKEATDTQWYHVVWNVSVALYNLCALARLYGVKYSN